MRSTSAHPIKFGDFEIHVLVFIPITGSDYEPCDWDHDEEAFRAEMVKEAVAGVRHERLDIGDSALFAVEISDR